MKTIIFFLIISIFLQSTVTTLPIIIPMLLFVFNLFDKEESLLIAFVFGILLDILSFRIPGFSSLIFICIIYFSSLYERKLELNNIYFLTLVSFLGTFAYLFLTGAPYIILQSIFISIITFIAFFVFSNKKEKASYI